MARFSNGWVKIPREISVSFRGDLSGLGLYCHLMMLANWQDGETKVRLPEGWGVIKKGSLITSIGELADFFAVDRRAMRRWLKKLQNAKLIESKSGVRCHQLTICNYLEITESEFTSGSDVSQPRSLEWSARVPHSKEEELIINNKKEEKISIPPLSSPISSHEFLKIWNSNSGHLPKVDIADVKMELDIQRKFFEKPDKAYWASAASQMATSAFLSDKPWASLEWLLKDDNHRKVSSGTYSNKTPQSEFQRRQKMTMWERDGFKTQDEWEAWYKRDRTKK